VTQGGTIFRMTYDEISRREEATGA